MFISNRYYMSMIVLGNSTNMEAGKLGAFRKKEES
jgi:hypothetical protein